jgi:hypothetical protein
MALIKLLLTRVIFLCQSRRVGQAPSADSVMRRANRTVLDPHLTPAVMPLATGDGTASEQGVHGPARVAGRRPTFARCPADAGATVHSTSTCSCSRTLSRCTAGTMHHGVRKHVVSSGAPPWRGQAPPPAAAATTLR